MEGDEDYELDTSEDEIIKGDSNVAAFASNDRRVASTVRIRNMTLPENCAGTVGLGTGVLLENNVVLTARHVITNYGSSCDHPTSAAPLSKIYVYAQDSTQNPPSCSTTGSCSHPVSVMFAPGSLDVALIFLDDPVRGYKGSTVGHGVPIAVHDVDAYLNQAVGLSGYGDNNCAGTGYGTLRFGSPIVTQIQPTWFVVEPNATGHTAAPGDSGGPAWTVGSSPTWPQSALGVTSTAACGYDSVSVNAEAYRVWARTAIAQRKPTYTYQFGTSTNIDEPYWKADNPANSDNTPAWYLGSDGRLHENSNALGRTSAGDPNYPDGAMMLRVSDVHESAYLDVNVKSTDNDAAGFVFRYVDSTHYYVAAVNQQNSTATIYRRNGSTFTLLGSGTRSVNWSVSGGANLRLKMQDETFKFYVNGVLSASGSDGKYPVGQVGLFKYALANASFDGFRIEPLDPVRTSSWPQ